MNIIKFIVIAVAAYLINGCATAPQSSVQSASTVASAMSGAGMASGAANAVSTIAQTPGLVDILVQQLGVTPTQATGGAGSIFSMAQQTMTPSNFGIISKAVPGMDSLLAAAPSTATPNLMGGAANALGGGSLGKMASLASSFQSLGMNSGVMNQFIPVVLQYMQNQGGSTAMSLLQSAILP
ncbi:MAG: DUF2780 domain-containing protein [Gammaproteobacteria bacterium]|nr:DUF2780 domain-containing protein [Gammaproteobacteria bacterium]